MCKTAILCALASLAGAAFSPAQMPLPPFSGPGASGHLALTREAEGSLSVADQAE